MADDKAEAFVRSLLGDIFGCFSLAAKVNIEFPPDLEENRCVPPRFFSIILDFSKPFTSALQRDVSRLPVLLYASEDFFKRFTHSVCLKLTGGEDDGRTAFLKLTAFLVTIATIAVVDGCYRALDDIPGVYERMLKDHLTTKFYIEKKFGDMASKCRELLGDEKWTSSTVDEMRRFIAEARDVELATTKIIPDSFQQQICNLRILDVRKQSVQSDSDIVRCKYCGMNCVLALKMFFQPRIKYKPDCPLM